MKQTFVVRATGGTRNYYAVRIVVIKKNTAKIMSYYSINNVRQISQRHF
jgi:hypothetical protein